ncbi:MAG TPA: TerB family tellurite resistance protein [Chryseosolibacter sp.]|nr:TerB family tellurite resistance protein [Chryseosolibacter sp.]
MKRHYHLGLLCLTHLLINADGIVDVSEMDALRMIKDNEGIADSLFDEFQKLISSKKEKEIYQFGIDLMRTCTDEEKLKVFVTLYKLSEVDGRVHVKEIRLLLYSLRISSIEFNDVVNHAMTTPSLI